MLVALKGIHKVKRKLADGTARTYYYAWRGGPKMEAKPHTEAFALEFARLKGDATPKVVETLESLIDRFTGPESKRNHDFLALADTTQTDHLYAFKLIKAKWPKLPAKLTQQKGMKAEIRKWHRSFTANPRKADKLLFSLSKVFSYAIADEIIEKNPCTGIERLYSGSRRESVWSQAQIKAFRAGAPAHLLLAFEMALHTGQRQGDLLALSWKDYDGIYLQFRQSKTDKRLKVRVHSTLKAMLDPMDKDKLRILLNSRKRPWTKDGFKTSWGKECGRLKIGAVTFHDLRGTFITERAREGSSVENIAKISGHSISEIKSVLEKHYLADDQDASDAVILRMERNP
ncbi:tyrosine-type recombinase/integrase [Mesorhizobium sp. M0938]|uniref:tyrosine-type recombinase/integrase n=1 Tax=unclassified Mesorhizobium TaxID=325217 RepID=UPI003338CA0D